MQRFEFIDHTADIIIKAYGSTLEEAFGGAADGLFAIITDHADLQGSETVRFEVESIDIEGLLVSFLSHLIVRFETENVLLSEFEIELKGTTALSGTARSEPFAENRHGLGSQVKGVSYHMIEIDPGGDGRESSVTVLCDI